MRALKDTASPEQTYLEQQPAVIFQIRFIYNGLAYTAQVFQKDGIAMEYLVMGVTPALDYLPDPFVVASNLRRDMFEFPVNETYHPVSFGKTVIAAIELACAEMGIPVFCSKQRAADHN